METFLFQKFPPKPFKEPLQLIKHINPLNAPLEATETVEPNPDDLNKSTGDTNFWNCGHDGPILYQEAVTEQLEAMRKK